MVGIGKPGWARELDAAVRVLAGADTVAFGGVGIAGTLLPATEAYQRVEAALAAHPEAARKHVDRLLRRGSPAGKAYAATLLDRVDPAAARKAWAALRDEPGGFSTFTGCVMGSTTLRAYAADRLAGG
ncbi:hypothetical protein [Micromonospora sp. KC723]|uniref:hypothetical protein n=1 Tax=Micromonospora sp. KC723 TaxID=2530381 RepID=UPI00104C586B|nr:hypothetical protein [Micromonospora sp. KC723]TDB73713.1 hypothetical protein E1165_16475 [Micromonospora sp. KC723]